MFLDEVGTEEEVIYLAISPLLGLGVWITQMLPCRGVSSGHA